MGGERGFPVGASVTIEQLDQDPHSVLARLRASEPVSWLPALDGWLVTRHGLALDVMRDAVTFTVDDPRFSTARVIGPSMLSLDGREHRRHREPFVPPFRSTAVRERFAGPVAVETQRLLDQLAPAGTAELRRSFAGPLATRIVALALGMQDAEVGDVLAWYDAIVAAVTDMTAGGALPASGQEAFGALDRRLRAVIDAGDSSSLLSSVATSAQLGTDQVVSNAAVLLFGGIETTEGMIANAIAHLLEHPAELALVRRHPQLLDSAIEESLRLEPAAAVVDRYATSDASLSSASIARGDLVRVSIAGANRDPAVFSHPNRFDLRRSGPRGHLAFAHGPHVCVGIHLARLEARVAISELLRRLSGLRLDPQRPPAVRGLVFRKPQTLHALWDA
ncbi:MAG: cytochrome P450 [Actinomycetota bacterium]|nr:cytochrome P450 [Actinomycetota bacterium]